VVTRHDVGRLTNFLEAIIRQSFKNPWQIDQICQISGKNYNDLFMKKQWVQQVVEE
jgi:hypothetical protein